MPLYEYYCLECEQFFERIVSYKKRDLQTCDDCDTHDVKRAISKSSFRLKGGGWYKDGYHAPQKKEKPDK